MKQHLCRCNDCEEPISAGYMVLPAVWQQAWDDHAEPSAERDRHLCLTCLQGRLGRGLELNDFNLMLPINQGILWGYSISARWKKRS